MTTRHNKLVVVLSRISFSLTFLDITVPSKDDRSDSSLNSFERKSIRFILCITFKNAADPRRSSSRLNLAHNQCTCPSIQILHSSHQPSSFQWNFPFLWGDVLLLGVSLRWYWVIYLRKINLELILIWHF